MRILILGAGAIGGYFGARLAAAGGDVTFLVRSGRAEQLKASGLGVRSPLGDVYISPKVATEKSLAEAFDLIILSCKAYDLESAMEAVAPAIGDKSHVLPLLNGSAHLQKLDERFGKKRVLGGVAHLAVTMKPNGDIEHLNKFHRLIIGARTPDGNEPCEKLRALLQKTSLQFTVSRNIEQAMWEKHVFLATLAAATCTMRASIGHIVQTIAGREFILGLLDECIAVAVASQHEPDHEQLKIYRSQLTDENSTLTASMLRDIERNGRTEADHVIGDMVRRGEAENIALPLLRLAYSHLQAYETRAAAALEGERRMDK
jgi:2-dehydropantoate 2-reductase